MKRITKRSNFILILVGTIILLTSSGCVNHASARVSPEANLSAIDKIYVGRHMRDKRGINKLISNQLNKMGYKSTTGPETAEPKNVDAVATYKDRWMWDITTYMWELNITLRKPGKGLPLATGRSMHGSLTRKSPEKMVEEVLTNIFKSTENSQ